MRVLVANAQAPFIRGGAEMLADNLVTALQAAGHSAELITIPFKWYPAQRIPDAMLAARLLEATQWLGGSIDRLIGLKFPAYLIRHPHKVLWLLHQYRGAYDLWDTDIGDLSHAPDGRAVRDFIRTADAALIPECRAVFTISRNVSARLQRFNGIESRPLYHPPPNASQFRHEQAQDFLLCPGRINPTKRQHLVVEALRLCQEEVKVVFIGMADAADYAAALLVSCTAANIGHRVQWRGRVSETEKLSLYARCLGVVIPPLDEDYGYVTLEAMLSAKPVLTCTDSGGPLDFVIDGETGCICEPEPAALALALDSMWRERARAQRQGRAGLDRYHALGLNWPNVVLELLA